MGALHEQRRFNDSDRTALSSLFTDLVEKLKTDLLGMPDSPSDFEQIVRLETALPSLNQCAVSLSLSADLIGQLETPLTNYYSKAPQIYEPIFQTIASARFNRENFGQYQNLIGAISSTPKLNAAVENSEAKVSFQRAKSNLEIARAQYLGNYFTNEIDRQPKCIVADGPMQIYRSFNVERAYPARAIEREKSGRVSLLLRIDEHGDVISAQFTQISDEIFRSEQILNIARQMKFYPKITNCLTEAFDYNMTVSFFLD